MTEKLNSAECPHCHQPMKKWRVPPESTWSAEYFLVCFNDECSYYLRGWEVMRGRYNVDASYRYHQDPTSGQKGPLPVWSADALRGDIIEE